MKTPVKIILISAIFLLLTACNNTTNNTTDSTTEQTTPTTSPAAQNPTGNTQIQVSVKEMEFQLSQTTVPAGNVEFVVTNKGTIPHEMEVIQTDLPIEKLPTTNDGRLDTEKAGKKIDEIEEDELKVGTTKTLKVNLTPGRYLLVCNLPGHFQAGMRTILTVQ